MTPEPLFLEGTYELDGVIVSGQEIKDAIIDSLILKDLKEGGNSK